MKKASEYREHARECRELAARMDRGEQREQLLAMARHWDQLADDRAALVRLHPELGEGDRSEARPSEPKST
ncbi:MAG: hypothetical protein KGO51_03040 [Alphaproteobacteria bacterium]|jgi:hypothetical protein|nr:hypothetical protein [Alphaproteobacteria bacterium]